MVFTSHQRQNLDQLQPLPQGFTISGKNNPTKVKNLYDLLTDEHKMVSQVALGCRYDYSKLSQ